MAKLLLVLLPLLAVPSRAKGTEDEAALLQTMVETEGDCECMNWTEAYNGSVACGDGLEHEDKDLNIDCSGENSFYAKAAHTFCMKAVPATLEGTTLEGKATKKIKTKGSWCYVRSKCHKLKGGKKVNKHVSYKMCKEGMGETLGELMPKDLFSLAIQTGTDAKQMVVMAYDWAGPSDSATEGSIQDGDDVSTGKALVGKSKKPDVLTVSWKSQLWEVSDTVTETEVKHEVSDTDACQCLKWTEVYNGGVTCGDGLEYEDKDLNIHCSGENSFYAKAAHAFCMKAVPATLEGEATKKNETTGSWCYVSSKCSELNGGKKVNKHVSYAMCKEGMDTLGLLMPKDLFSLAHQTGTDAKQMAVMAYDWAGPSDSATEGPVVSTGKALVCKSKKPDVFAITWMSQVWEISDTPKCWEVSETPKCGDFAEENSAECA